MPEKRISVAVSADDHDVAYLYLPDHPGRAVNGAIVKQVRLSSLLNYTGLDLYLDFDKHGRLVGVEVLA